ncbi:MAG: heavy-metal-associated domain-containing protein [Rubrivivax sp.]
MKTRISGPSLPNARLALTASALLAGAALVVFATAAGAQTPAPAKAAEAARATQASAVKLSVNGMLCAFCAQGIEARLKKLPETADLYINLKQKVVAVQAKPGQTLPVDKLKAEVVEAGYEVTRAEPMSQTVAQLREQMRGRQ